MFLRTVRLNVKNRVRESEGFDIDGSVWGSSFAHNRERKRKVKHWYERSP